MSTVKEQVLELVDKLPDDTTWEEVRYRIYIREKIAAGIRAGEEGRVTPHADVKRRFLESG